MTENATMAAAKMQPKCTKNAALRAVSEYNSDAMKEESLGELTPRAEPKDTIDGEGLGMDGEKLTSKETIKQ